MTLGPFESRERYARFLSVQHAFLSSVEPFYRDPEIARWIADAPGRSRLHAVEADLRDLNANADLGGIAGASAGRLEGLGWLYVAEGSKLGAAVLLKEAKRLGLHETFGARHLAAHAEGRGRDWRRFSSSLESLTLSAIEDESVVRGAQDAFDCFVSLLEPAFAVRKQPRATLRSLLTQSARQGKPGAETNG